MFTMFYYVVLITLGCLAVIDCSPKSFEPQPFRWSWGYVDDSRPPEPISTLSPLPKPTTNEQLLEEPKEDDDPCSEYKPPPKNFSIPGRRLSQIKCYEFINDIQIRQERKNRQERCSATQTFGIAAIGGRDTVTGEFPHMGAIGWKAVVGGWIFKCGSSLISSKYVLTAGHCTRASAGDTTLADPVPQIVRLGDKNILDKFNNGVSKTEVKIKRIIPHPEYQPPRKYNDIALIELESEVTFSELVQPACLWGTFDTNSLAKQATLTGWGVVETSRPEIHPELQAAVVDIIDTEQCNRLLRRYHNRLWCGIRDQICGGVLKGGVDACQGDSGGPLQVKINLPPTTKGLIYYVIGVISFGIGCARPDTPGVYTRVSSYIDWIEDIVWR